MAFPGVGPLTPGGGMPGGGRSLASPELAGMTPTPGPESRTFLSSPIADRLSGPLMHMQKMEAAGKAAQALRQGMQLLARMLMDTDPRGAMQLEQLAAKLLTIVPAQRVPQSANAAQQLTQSLPAGRGGPMAQVPPPPISGSGTSLSGLAMP